MPADVDDVLDGDERVGSLGEESQGPNPVPAGRDELTVVDAVAVAEGDVDLSTLERREFG